MAQVKRYFHIRPLKRVHRQWVPAEKAGATVCVTGDTERVGTVMVQYSLCSVKQTFQKREGRIQADKAEGISVSLRFLPQALNLISEEVDHKVKKAMTPDQDYSFAIKYFLPK